MGVKILAVASGGGHWEQLMLLRPTLDQFDTTYVTTAEGVAVRDGVSKYVMIPDANGKAKAAILRTVWHAIGVLRRSRPEVVVSTGALPGLACIIVGYVIGARTVWVDSVANSERLSVSGRFARPFSTLWLTQWPAVAAASGARYGGCLL